MLHMEETEKLLYRLTEWEQEQAAGRMTQREFRSALEALPRDLRPLDWYGIEAPAPGGREDTALPEFDEKSFILSGGDVCVRKHDTRDATPPHSHNFYELIAVLDGTARNAMENREVELGRGQLFLLCPKAVHGISCSPDAVVLNVLIRASFFRASFPAVFGVGGVQEGLFSPPGAPGRCMLFDMGEDEETRALVLLLARESLSSRPNRRAAVNGALALLFSFLLDHGEMVQKESPKKYEAEMREILSYLSACCADATLAGAAEQLHFSTRHIARILRETGQKSFNTLLREARVAAARRLLEETNLTVEEVAQAAGFSEGGYFIRVFRRETGTTPALYRAQYQQNHKI